MSEVGHLPDVSPIILPRPAGRLNATLVRQPTFDDGGVIEAVTVTTWIQLPGGKTRSTAARVVIPAEGLPEPGAESPDVDGGRSSSRMSVSVRCLEPGEIGHVDVEVGVQVVAKHLQ